MFAVIVSVPLFGDLDTLPIRIWDEARVAVNSYEMSQNGNLIVTHFEGEPDMWNVKPPLLIWAQAFCMKIFGVNELAVRLPSAIAALLTCLVLLIFGLRYLKDYWFGFIAVMVLITSYGYLDLHGARNGDYDAPLTLFTTLSGLLFFAYCETKKQQHLYLFFLFITLGVLTKGIAGLLFIPAFAIYGLLQKEIIPLLKNKHFYFGFMSFLVVVVGYYVLRELNNPGFLEAVQKNELGGRYLEVIENHKKPFWWYYNSFLEQRFAAWYLLVPCGLIVGWFNKEAKVKKLAVYLSLLILTYFLVISSAETKLRWYDLPLYPFLSLLVTIFLHFIYKLLYSKAWFIQTLTINLLPFLFLCLVFVTPYKKTIDRTHNPQERKWRKDFYDIGYYLREAVHGKHDLNGQFLLYKGYYAHNLFYLNVLNDQGTDISIKDWKELQPGDIVIAPQQKVKNYIAKHYLFEVVKDAGNVITYRIHGRIQFPKSN